MRKLFIITLAALIFAGCSDKEEETAVYTVIFNSNGGSPTPQKQTVKAGETATAPADNPSKQGYVFLFWSLNNATTAYNFQSPVNADIMLNANWQEESKVEYWQVLWVLNGGAWASGYTPPAQVVKGGTLAEPTAPVRSGYTFDGWYREAALTNKVSFPYSVPANSTLYAKWNAESGGNPTTFTIRNTSEWNSAISAITSGDNDKSYTLEIVGTVSVPPTVGVEQGRPWTYTFGAVRNLTVTLTGSGTLALSGKGFLICLSGVSSLWRQKLIIDGPTLQGRADNTVQLLRLEDADLELKNGKITGNTNDGSSGATTVGGVRISWGEFNMSGGEISNNNSCGVFLENSTFNLSGGTISGNTGSRGGGVYFVGGTLSSRSFNMTGGVIKGNTASSQSPCGGGVFISSNTIFNKTGGIIYGSNASETDRNRVVNHLGSVLNNQGAAIFYTPANSLSHPNNRRRETTLGENDNISTDSNTGWVM